MKKEIDRKAIRSMAEKFVRDLSRSQVFELGDALVLGTLDWRDWLEEPPPPGFWRHVDYFRILREEIS